ncbi:MAG: hypothetical protein NXI25_18275 [bacterium]|nr:hypothetical protein [bacterium]
MTNHHDNVPSSGAQPGYKQTKLGWLPVEWEVVQLGKIVKKLESGVSVNCVDSAYNQRTSRVVLLKTSAVTSGSFLYSETKTPLEEEEKN